MPNIFDGLNKLDNSAIIENIAMLEAINMGNLMKGYGSTVVNKGAKAINGIGRFFGKHLDVIVKEEKKLEDYIEESKRDMSCLNRNELNLRLKNLLSDKTDCNSNTEDAISAHVINSVSQHMKLGVNMTVAQKADGIHRRYLEKILNVIQEKLKKQDSTEVNKTINEIEKNISNLNEKDKEQLKKILNVEELTGKEIRNVLLKAGAPSLIMAALSASGFGAFMALTTVIHALFTTILGVTLPFAVYTGATSALSFLLGPAGIGLVAGTAIWQITKGNKNLKNEIMGQIVFIAVNANEGSFVAKNEDLPSYEINEEKLDKIKKIDEEYEKLVDSNTTLQQKVDTLENKYKESQDNILIYKKQIQNEKIRREDSENQIIALKHEKEIIAKNLKKSKREINILENEINIGEDEKLKLELDKMKILNVSYEKELCKLNENISYQNNIIEDASHEITEQTKEIILNENKNIELQKENEAYKREIKLKDEKIQKTEKIRKKEIQEKWSLYFPKFEIRTSAIRDAGGFSKKEIWEIEKVLIELHSLDDYKSASRGKIKDKGYEYEHMGFSLPCGFPTRILYSVLNDSNKKVVIHRIYKHNSKLYQ